MWWLPDINRIRMCDHTRINELNACFLSVEHRFLHGNFPKRDRAVMLLEVKNIVFRDYLQQDNRSYPSPCQFHVYLSSALASQPDLTVIVMQWYILLSSRRGCIKRPPRRLFLARALSNRWRQECHTRSFTGLPPLPHHKVPGVALRSHP